MLFITIDVEPDHNKSGYIFPLNFDNIDSNIPKILELLKDYDSKATFFISLPAVEKRMKAVENILKQKHEIGNHTHPMFSKYFGSTDLLNHYSYITQKKMITEIHGELKKFHPKSFRAGKMRANGNTIKVLEELNYKIDSSSRVIGIHSRLARIVRGNKLYHPSKFSIQFPGKSSILELPVSRLHKPFDLNLPIDEMKKFLKLPFSVMLAHSYDMNDTNLKKIKYLLKNSTSHALQEILTKKDYISFGK